MSRVLFLDFEEIIRVALGGRRSGGPVGQMSVRLDVLPKFRKNLDVRFDRRRFFNVAQQFSETGQRVLGELSIISLGVRVQITDDLMGGRIDLHAAVLELAVEQNRLTQAGRSSFLALGLDYITEILKRDGKGPNICHARRLLRSLYDQENGGAIPKLHYVQADKFCRCVSEH